MRTTTGRGEPPRPSRWTCTSMPFTRIVAMSAHLRDGR